MEFSVGTRIEERLPENEAELLTEHNNIPYFWLAWVHFVLFAVGVTEWAEPSGAWHGFWHAFGGSLTAEV